MGLQLDNNVITPNSIIANLYSKKQACASNILDSDSNVFADCLEEKVNSSNKKDKKASQDKESDKKITEKIETKTENLLKSSLREIQNTMNFTLTAQNLAQNLCKNYNVSPVVTSMATQAVSYIL